MLYGKAMVATADSSQAEPWQVTAGDLIPAPEPNICICNLQFVPEACMQPMLAAHACTCGLQHLRLAHVSMSIRVGVHGERAGGVNSPCPCTSDLFSDSKGKHHDGVQPYTC